MNRSQLALSYLDQNQEGRPNSNPFGSARSRSLADPAAPSDRGNEAKATQSRPRSLGESAGIKLRLTTDSEELVPVHLVDKVYRKHDD